MNDQSYNLLPNIQHERKREDVLSAGLGFPFMGFRKGPFVRVHLNSLFEPPTRLQRILSCAPLCLQYECEHLKEESE